MSSVSDFDDDIERMVTDLLPSYDNNRSKVIRESIRCLHEIDIAKEKRNTMIDLIQASTLFVMGCGLFIFAVSMLFNIPFLMVTAVVLLLISGMLIMALTFINNQKAKPKKERSDAA